MADDFSDNPFAANPAFAPPDATSRGLWGDVMGIGPLVRMATDPTFQANVQGMVAAITAAAMAIPRVEAKLDALLGPDHPLVRATPRAPESAVLPLEHRPAGAGGFGPAGGAPDHGSGPGADAFAPTWPDDERGP